MRPLFPAASFPWIALLVVVLNGCVLSVQGDNPVTPGTYRTSGTGTGASRLVLGDSTFDSKVNGCDSTWRHEVGTWKYEVLSPTQRYLRFSNITDTIFHNYCGQAAYVQSVNFIAADSVQVGYSTPKSLTLYDPSFYSGPAYEDYDVGVLYFWTLADDGIISYDRL
jgi:hypothetical protein